VQRFDCNIKSCICAWSVSESLLLPGMSRITLYLVTIKFWYGFNLRKGKFSKLSLEFAPDLNKAW